MIKKIFRHVFPFLSDASTKSFSLQRKVSLETILMELGSFWHRIRSCLSVNPNRMKLMRILPDDLHVKSAMDYNSRQVNDILQISSTCCTLFSQGSMGIADLSQLVTADFTTFIVAGENPQQNLHVTCRLCCGFTMDLQRDPQWKTSTACSPSLTVKALEPQAF